MKKITYILAMSSALLFGCNDEEATPKKVTEAEADVAVEEILENAEVVDEATLPEATTPAEPAVTPEQAEQTITTMVETATKDEVVEEVKVVEEDNTVTASIAFTEDVSEEDKATFIFNYSLFLDLQYPDQEIEFDIQD